MSQNNSSPRPPIRAATLDDLSAAVVDVTIQRPDGQAVIVPMRALTEGEVWEIRRAVKWPKPPVKDIRKESGRLVTDYNYEDETYQEAVNSANREQAHRMLLTSLSIEIAGDTIEERVAALRAKVGQFVLSQLIEASQKLNIVNVEDLASIADSFRLARFAHAGSADAAGADAGAVAGDAAHRENGNTSLSASETAGADAPA